MIFNKYCCVCVIVLFSFSITSCGKSKPSSVGNNVISLKNSVGIYNILNISDYATSIRYIPLETNDSVLISAIDQIVYENGSITIKSDWMKSECLVFNDNGVFCNKIGSHGQGPNEYTVISDIFTFDDLIFLITSPAGLLSFQKDGTFVKKISSPDNLNIEDHIRLVLPLNSNTYFTSLTSYGDYYPKTVLFEIDGVESKVIKEFIEPIKIEKTLPIVTSYEFGLMYHFKNDVRFYKYTNCDTIFTIGQDFEMKDAFIFDFGKYKPTRKAFDPIDKDVNNKPIYPEIILESSDYLFIKFMFFKDPPERYQYLRLYGDGESRLISSPIILSVFDKNTGELRLMKQPIKNKLGFKNDIDGGPVIYPNYISTKDELVTFISPEDFLEHYEQIENPTPELQKITKNIKPDDNPIVIIAKLKK